MWYTTQLQPIDSGHLITSLVDFPEDGRSIPEEAVQDYDGSNPFVGFATNGELKNI